MNIYIRSAANISPQPTFASAYPFSMARHTGIALRAIEPDYKGIIDAKLTRRMSRIVKMGVAAALHCLAGASVTNPDAITMGTAYGCVRDTEQFLTSLIQQHEEMLSPTSFIQSTHNTVGAQIALLLQCNNYNNTFVNGGHSFENALLDAVMLLRENEATHVLAGSADELTDISHTLLSRFGLYRRHPISTADLFTIPSRGTIAGEGAAFFLLSTAPPANDLARLRGLTTFYGIQTSAGIASNVTSFLASHSLDISGIDLVITGKNGDKANDIIYNQLSHTVFSATPVINYKHLCGDYPTAISFAVWLAAYIVKSGLMPTGMKFEENSNTRPQRILICNNYRQLHHSLILISA